MTEQPSSRQRRFAWIRSAIERRSASAFGIIMVVVLGLIGAVQGLPNWFSILVVTAVIVFEFQKRLDQGVPLLQLTSLIAVLQWLVGPLLSYSSENAIERYTMSVPAEQYFRYAIPATALYVAVMLFAGASVRQKNLLQQIDRRKFFTIGVLLNIVAIIAALAAARVSGSLAFLMHLLSQLRYVGAIYFLLSRSQVRLVFAALSCVQLLTSSLGAGMFHDMILWLAILFCYWFAQKKRTALFKAVVLTATTVSLFSIQVVKQEYREQLRQGAQPNLFSLVLDYVTPGGRAWETSVLSLAITRLNQGWIISAVMHHVPEHEPFARGETVKDAVLGSMVPRFLWADKATAGGRESFRRFTGLRILDSTSMAISPLGEAYANFGEFSGTIFMVVFGGCFAVFYRLTLRYCLKYPTFLFWIPLIFYQAVKAETELLVIMNQLVKGSVVAFGCHFLVERVFPTRIRNLRPANSALSLPMDQPKAIA